MSNSVNNDFKARFSAKWGANKPINAIGEATYSAVWLYAKAIAKAGSVDPEKVIPAMSQVEHEAPQGHVNLSAKNNHMRCNGIMARVPDKATFEMLQNYGQIDPIVPGS